MEKTDFNINSALFQKRVCAKGDELNFRMFIIDSEKLIEALITKLANKFFIRQYLGIIESAL